MGQDSLNIADVFILPFFLPNSEAGNFSIEVQPSMFIWSRFKSRLEP